MSGWQVASIAVGGALAAAAGGAVIGIAAQKARMLAPSGERLDRQTHNDSTARTQAEPHAESDE